MKNISQATYDRIRTQTRDTADSWRPRVMGQDVRDLLAAYEEAVELLDNLVGVSHNASGSREVHEAEEFLYLESGEPRVHLEGA